MTTARPRKHYARHPLVESIFELFAGDDGIGSWTAASVAAGRLAFPTFQFHEEKIRDVGISLHIKDAALEPKPLSPRERVRWWDEARGRAVQFGAHMCAHNVLSSAYTHFDDHKPVIADVTRFYLDNVRPKKIEWVGQRYINSIKLPKDESNVAQYFEIYPQLPALLAGGHRPLAVQLQTVDFKLGTAMVNLSLQSVNERDATYTLDIYARSTGEIPLDVDALLRWQVLAHEAVYDSFQYSVSQKSKTDLFGEVP
jgi:uncharacterized protein (TIGR04255 family)